MGGQGRRGEGARTARNDAVPLALGTTPPQRVRLRIHQPFPHHHRHTTHSQQKPRSDPSHAPPPLPEPVRSPRCRHRPTVLDPVRCLHCSPLCSAACCSELRATLQSSRAHAAWMGVSVTSACFRLRNRRGDQCEEVMIGTKLRKREGARRERRIPPRFSDAAQAARAVSPPPTGSFESRPHPRRRGPTRSHHHLPRLYNGCFTRGVGKGTPRNR